MQQDGNEVVVHCAELGKDARNRAAAVRVVLAPEAAQVTKTLETVIAEAVDQLQPPVYFDVLVAAERGADGEHRRPQQAGALVVIDFLGALLGPSCLTLRIYTLIIRRGHVRGIPVLDRFAFPRVSHGGTRRVA